MRKYNTYRQYSEKGQQTVESSDLTIRKILQDNFLEKIEDVSLFKFFI